MLDLRVLIEFSVDGRGTLALMARLRTNVTLARIRLAERLLNLF
jgi:hypothetical protein